MQDESEAVHVFRNLFPNVEVIPVEGKLMPNFGEVFLEKLIQLRASNSSIGIGNKTYTPATILGCNTKEINEIKPRYQAEASRMRGTKRRRQLTERVACD